MVAPPVISLPDAAALEASELARFARRCEELTGRDFPTYEALRRWSVEEPGAFWGSWLEWSGVLHDGPPAPALVGEGVEGARFFPNVSLSYAENLLAGARRHEDEGGAAITACDESGRLEVLSWADLREQVERLAAGLAALGVRQGDRVVAVARNAADTVVACLAATALGAIWAATAPDMGLEAIQSRFGQLAPRWMVAHGVQRYAGQLRPLGDLVQQLAASLPSLEGVIALDEAPLPPLSAPLYTRASVEARGAARAAPWPRLPFDHPLFILFSSGTTGAPKCIMHGVGGTLLEHTKEHRLHADLGPRDVLYFHTTCAWMMWNWLVSALASGVHIVVYDGSVSYPTPTVLIELLERERVTVFGTSPVYLQFLEISGLDPSKLADLGALRLIQSTGSVLYPKQFDFARERIKPVPLHSISGGTDILGCFVLGSPSLPVTRGESPCVGLGLDVRVLDERGLPQAVGVGELVCASPFPSRPVGFYGDEDGSRMRSAYFSQNPGIWTHGDFIELTERGTARILGRSDGILNIKGVRIGPAEIYAALHDVEALVEAMALALEDPDALGGRRLVLLVVLREGPSLDRPLVWQIKRLLKQRCSANHVPEQIVAVPELPTTHSGKRSERAAQDLLDGRPVRNLDALRNPASLDAIAAALRPRAPS